MDTPKKLALPYPSLDEDVLIQINGKEYPLRFTIGTFKKLKAKLGRAMISRTGVILELDEEFLPEVLLQGLATGNGGKAPDGVTTETFENMPASAIPYLIQRFTVAYLQFQAPPKNGLAAVPAAAADPKPTSME